MAKITSYIALQVIDHSCSHWCYVAIASYVCAEDHEMETCCKDKFLITDSSVLKNNALQYIFQNQLHSSCEFF